MRPFTCVASVAVLAVFAASPVLAHSCSSWQIQDGLEVTGATQFSSQSPTPDALARLDNRLIRARMVRISTPPGLIEAEGVRAGAEGLTYRSIVSSTRRDTLPTPGVVPWDAVLGAQVPGTYARKGALIGGALLGVAGAWAGMLLTNLGVEESNPAGTATGAAVGLGVGGLVGLGLGASVGVLIHDWKQVYPNRH